MTSHFGFILAPYERTTSYMKGAGLGPEALCGDWRRLVESGQVPEPAFVARLSGENLRLPAAMVRAVEKAVRLQVKKGLFPVLLGGEHTVALGAVSSLASGRRKLGIIQFDAHADLRGRYQGSEWSHACVMRKIVQEFDLPILPVGLRAFCRQEARFLERRAIGTLPGRRLRQWPSLLPPLLDTLPDRVYLTVDMDYFDPSVVPGVGTPEPGGGEWYETLEMLDFIAAKKEIAGLDVVELCPPREERVSVRAATRLIAHVLNAAGVGM